MSIHEVTDIDVLQHCAACDTERRVLLDELEAGVAHGDQVDPLLVPLPPCPACGSSEFLVRTPDNEPEHPAPGSFGHLHRMLVDHLHAELVHRDKVVAALRDREEKLDDAFAKPLGVATRERWFPQGLKIEAPAREQPETAGEDPR